MQLETTRDYRFESFRFGRAKSSLALLLSIAILLVASLVTKPAFARQNQTFVGTHLGQPYPVLLSSESLDIRQQQHPRHRREESRQLQPPSGGGGGAVDEGDGGGGDYGGPEVLSFDDFMCNHYNDQTGPYDMNDDEQRDTIVMLCCMNYLDFNGEKFYHELYYECACEVFNLLDGGESSQYYRESQCDTWVPSYVTKTCSIIGLYGNCYNSCQDYFTCSCTSGENLALVNINEQFGNDITFIGDSPLPDGYYNLGIQKNLYLNPLLATQSATYFTYEANREFFQQEDNGYIVQLKIPLQGDGQRCDFCQIGLDPCEDNFGSGPSFYEDCYQNLCPAYDRCATLLDATDRVGTEPFAIVDYSLGMCPAANTSPKQYKTAISDEIEPSNTVCFSLLVVPENYFYGFTPNFDNVFYMTPSVLETICGIEKPCQGGEYEYEGDPDYCVNELVDSWDCQIPWVQERPSFELLQEIYENDIQTCFTFQENLSGIGEDLDPCVAYYDDEQNNCAICKINSIRIFIVLDNDEKFVFCGSVRTSERDENGVYQYLDPEDYSVDDIAEGYYECKVHPYYQTTQPKAYTQALEHTYHPQNYLNITDNNSEFLCIDPFDFLSKRKCEHTGVKPTQAQIDTLSGENQAVQASLIDITVGCNICEDGFIPTVQKDKTFGIYKQTCQDTDNFDFTDDNVPCEDIGYTQQWTGYIPEEQHLECTLCETLIPDCLVCESTDSCGMCKAGFYETEVYDADGVPRLTCLRNFCGLTGRGSTCIDREPNKLVGCDRFDLQQVSMQDEEGEKRTLYLESCSICQPGYYKSIYTVYEGIQSVKFLTKCIPQEGEITKDFFIRPELSTFFTNSEDKKMYEQSKSEERGIRWDDPLFFIQNAISKVGSMNLALQQGKANFEALDGSLDPTQELDGLYENYELVTFNIWLFKGTHHFVTCEEFLMVKYPDAEDYVNYVFNEEYGETDVYSDYDLRAFSTLCKTTETYFPLKKQNLRYDNFKFYVRPLECKLAKSTFRDMSQLGNEDIFYENCVDFERGDAKPQLRVHGSAMFNITNFAQFENIEFTGVDNMIEVASTDGSEATTQKYQDILNSVPFKLCEFTNEPTGYLETAEPEQLESGDDNFTYSCTSGFNATTSGVAQDVDQACVTQKSEEPEGVRGCQGEPHHATFFEKSLYSIEMPYHVLLTPEFVYAHRHNVLFNLYAFDSKHSRRTHVPTLNLIDCDFTYFMDKQALIQVENNNFVEMATELAEGGGAINFDFGPYKQDETAIENQFMAQLGEDRGARIDISGSTFKHSHFCKGMISYREVDPISFAHEPKLIRFAKQANRTEADDDGRAESFIRIKDSVFDNLAYQQEINVLSNLKESTVDCGSGGVDAFFGCVFEPYDHRGFVINAKGFNGAIQIENSVFERNMAYIKDYLIIENPQTREYLVPETIQYSRFEDQTGQLNFKVCDDAYRGVYLINNLADAREGFDDEAFVRLYESISTIMLIANKGPLIVKNNTFQENIGTFGGAIHVMSPDFESNAGLTAENTKPYILIKDNTFERNMAYFAGNGLYLAHTVKRYTNTIDYLNSCGAGVHVTSNIFKENIGLRKHNGGAVVHRCIPILDSTESFAASSHTSSLPLEVREKTFDDEGDFEFYYEDPTSTVDSITDLYDSSISYEILKYASVYQYNSFDTNFAGMSGSALMVSMLTDFILRENSFTGNGPVTTARELEMSPYVKYLALGKKTLTLSLLISGCAGATNEVNYVQECYDPLFFVDAPALKGAVHIENCHGSIDCNLPITTAAFQIMLFEYTDEEIEAILSEFMEMHQVNLIRKHSEIANNLFEMNQILPVIQHTQTQQQASCLYILGGINYVHGNTFKNHIERDTQYLIESAPKISEYAPPMYFYLQQAPLIYIFYEEGNDKYGTQYLEDAFYTQVENNNFFKNAHVQVALIDYHYTGSLIQYESDFHTSQFKFNTNVVEYNQFLGEETSLVSINGGVFTIENNILRNNGALTSVSVQKHPDSVDSERWPYNPYVFQASQVAGVFSFYFKHSNIPDGREHTIRNNTFSHNFCVTGCAFKVLGDKSHKMAFANNTYSFQVAQQSGAVFDGSSYTPQVSKKDPTHLHFFLNETVSHTVGNAIYVKNKNQAALTMLVDCNFYENYGASGGAINIDNGGMLVAFNVNFKMNPLTVTMPETLKQVANAKIRLDRLGGFETQTEEEREVVEAPSFAELLKASFSGTEDSLEKLIDSEQLSIANGVVNQLGQVQLIENTNSRDVSKTRIEMLDKTYGEYIKQFVGDAKLEFPFGSVFKDCVFRNLKGFQASSITMISTTAIFISTDGSKVNFERNVSPTGSTIFVLTSALYLDSIRMVGNVGSKGGCIQLSTSELVAVNSEFSQNVALQGGVIFAISTSIFRVEQSTLSSNIAADGGVLYGMSNQFSFGDYNTIVTTMGEDGVDEPPLGFVSSLIKDNWAESNMVHILLSKMIITDCEIVDNYAQYVTHGITMISSELTVKSSQIYFSDEGLAKIQALPLEKLDTGFFNLYLESSLTLADKTVVRHMTGQKQSVLSAISQSSVFTHNDVLFESNSAVSREGFTMGFSNTKQIEIADSRFVSNNQININVELSDLSLTNCTFTDGYGNHIKAKQANLVFDLVHIYDSSDDRIEGHGLYCDTCFDVSIFNSTFAGLIADKGSAISIQRSSEGSKTLIKDSVFQGNTALSKAGAICLENAANVTLKDNRFIGNKVEGKAADWRFRDGGAVYFLCDPQEAAEVYYPCEVVLDSNRFEKNSAMNKGGAMRYVNKNFTTVFAVGETGRRLLSDSGSPLEETAATDTNTYIDNVAAYGDDIASYPYSYQYVFTQSGFKYALNDTSTVTLAPGQELGLVVEIFDKEGRLCSDENDAVCTLEFVSNQDLADGSVIVNPAAVANKGVITFDALQIRQKPDTDAKINLLFSNLVLFGNEVEKFDQPPAHILHARTCLKGESYGEALTCLPCEPGFRLYESQLEPGSCEVCLDMEHCYGSNMTSPKPTYWRSSPTSSNYLLCYNPEACLGGDEEAPLGLCKEGYGGIMCANCVGRFRRTGAFECDECSTPTVNIFISIFYLGTLILAVVVLVRTSMRGSSERRPLSSVYIKIFLNHFQILQVVSSINFGWPELIQYILNVQRYIVTLPTEVISFDCLLIDYVTGPDPDLRFNYIRITFFYLLPLLVILVSYLFWLCKGCISGLTKQQRTDKTISTIAIIWFLFYPTIVSYLAKSINCTEIEETFRLYDDLEEKCFTGRHLGIIYLISIPGLILWAFGVPFLGYFFMRRFLREIDSKRFLSDPRFVNEMKQRFKLRLGFLTQGYQEKYYYWEIVLLLRKTTMVLLLTFLAPVSSGVQSLSLILLMIGSLVLQIKKQPFYDKRLNDLETVSLTVQIVIIYFGLFYQSGKSESFVKSDGTMYTFFLLVAIVSAQFIGLFCVQMRMEVLKASVKRNECCFRILSCGRIKDKEAFKKEHQLGNISFQNEIKLNKIDLKQAAQNLEDQSQIVDPAHVKLSYRKESSRKQKVKSASSLESESEESEKHYHRSKRSNRSHAKDNNVSINDMYQSLVQNSSVSMTQMTPINTTAMNVTAIEIEDQRVDIERRQRQEVSKLILQIERRDNQKSILKSQRAGDPRDNHKSILKSQRTVGELTKRKEIQVTFREDHHHNNKDGELPGHTISDLDLSAVMNRNDDKSGQPEAAAAADQSAYNDDASTKFFLRQLDSSRRRRVQPSAESVQQPGVQMLSNNARFSLKGGDADTLRDASVYDYNSNSSLTSLQLLRESEPNEETEKKQIQSSRTKSARPKEHKVVPIEMDKIKTLIEEEQQKEPKKEGATASKRSSRRKKSANIFSQRKQRKPQLRIADE